MLVLVENWLGDVPEVEDVHPQIGSEDWLICCLLMKIANLYFYSFWKNDVFSLQVHFHPRANAVPTPPHLQESLLFHCCILHWGHHHTYPIVLRAVCCNVHPEWHPGGWGCRDSQSEHIKQCVHLHNKGGWSRFLPPIPAVHLCKRASPQDWTNHSPHVPQCADYHKILQVLFKISLEKLTIAINIFSFLELSKKDKSLEEQLLSVDLVDRQVIIYKMSLTQPTPLILRCFTVRQTFPCYTHHLKIT